MLTARGQDLRTNITAEQTDYSEERAMAGSTLVARLAGMYPAVKATINNNNVASASVLPSVQATADAYRHGKHSEKRESWATK